MGSGFEGLKPYTIAIFFPAPRFGSGCKLPAVLAATLPCSNADGLLHLWNCNPK